MLQKMIETSKITALKKNTIDHILMLLCFKSFWEWDYWGLIIDLDNEDIILPVHMIRNCQITNLLSFPTEQGLLFLFPV